MKLVITGILACTLWIGHAQKMQTMNNATCVEVVTFRPMGNISQDSLKEAMASCNAIIKKLDGFISRTTSISETGEFTDVVLWETKAKALQAAEEAMKIPEIARNLALIDPKSIQMNHSEIFAIQQ